MLLNCCVWGPALPAWGRSTDALGACKRPCSLFRSGSQGWRGPQHPEAHMFFCDPWVTLSHHEMLGCLTRHHLAPLTLSYFFLPSRNEEFEM